MTEKVDYVYTATFKVAYSESEEDLVVEVNPRKGPNPFGPPIKNPPPLTGKLIWKKDLEK